MRENVTIRPLVLIMAICMFLLGACKEGGTASAEGERQASAMQEQVRTPVVDPQARYMAQIETHKEEEFLEILERAEAAIEVQKNFAEFEPIEFILHGPEAAFFLRSNYARYQNLVDRAARMDAFGVIDIKICEAWLSFRNVDQAELPAFIETVPYGPAAEKELLREGYVYF